MRLAGGIHYQEHGARDGVPLVFSSGLGGSGSYWRPNLEIDTPDEHFGRDHRVITYDHRGTGRSDRALPKSVTVDDLADDLLAVLDHAGVERADLVGHAAGAVAALSLALRAPQRVRTLTLVNGWSRPDPHFLRCFEARLALLRGSGPMAYVRAQPLFLYPPNWISDHAEELAVEDKAHFAVFAGAEAYEKRIAALAAFDVDDRLGDVAVPTLVLAAADDMLVPPKCSTRLSLGIPDARLQVMRWGGHACNVTDPKTFNRIVLDFLRS